MIREPREECHCPCTVWEENNCWPNWYAKKYWIGCQTSRSKIRYIVFQHKLLFNLVKDFFKWTEGLGRSVTVWVQSESQKNFDLGGIRKKYWIGCQISRSKTRSVVFQHKLLFNLVKDLLRWIEGLGKTVTVQVQSGKERIFDLGGIQKKVLDTLSSFALKNSLYSVSTKIAFQPSQGSIQKNWGSREECCCSSTVCDGKKNFDPGCIRKKY